MRNIEYWNIGTEWIRESAIDLRDRISSEFELNSFRDDVIFSDAVNDYCVDALRFLEKIVGKYRGRVVEAGAGTGIYSCRMAEYPEVEEVIAVEYSRHCVERLIPFVIGKFSFPPEIEDKIIPVVGSFNHMQLPDDSVDFVIDVGSIHHSENRGITLREIYRVLKIGGYLIGIDRASPNTFSSRELNARLDSEYSAEFKLQRGLTQYEKLSRRMNSEHDPLMSEWEYLLTRTGFEQTVFWIHEVSRKRKSIYLLWKGIFGLFFSLFGERWMKKRRSQFQHMKIPFFPFFSKHSPGTLNIIIVARKAPFIEMP